MDNGGQQPEFFIKNRTEQKFIRLKHIQLIVTKQKIHICESMIHMECTESEKHFQVEGQYIVAFS